MARLAGFAAAALMITAGSAAGCTAEPSTGGSAPTVSAPGASTGSDSGSGKGLAVETVASGLTHPWEVGFLPDGRMLVTQRPGKISLVADGRVTDLDADLTDVVARGEGGLMGLVVQGENRFTTCHNTAQDVRLVTWELTGTTAKRVADPLLAGLPANPSGRHSGCRLALDRDGTILAGTGDTARAAVSQDRSSLGGKVLRIDPESGQATVYTYGHRNVQGVAVREDGMIFTAEHGPDVDDEVNVLREGANYGWDPSRGGTVGGYNEEVPMTDLERFPDAVRAVWSSGRPTEALSDAVFLSGERWGDLDGVLAVTALKGSKLLLFTVTPEGGVHSVAVPPELDDTFGRLRGAELGPDGALYVTTSNGTDDKVLKLTPR
ncbi:glucose/arabinose dehydrogenase [Saccharothrix coeruleofusca]|uniref:PQQ-dependent sugar dehydrogenase n=1 Tax=Saccharothrix coeruleofusca TaxID=33919 RepID=UPI001AE9BA82|nr:PQQ-dependent sugar dehydrogenase [Saccharothrix coeruleofusca]MBP2340767.1 glucose/arabinose dehydrogenase [Saccharothrix coeruleofusca]